jgi:hypothetical protein
MIERVDRFEAENEWRVSVLLEDDRRKERRFEAMGAAMGDDAPEASQGGAPMRFLVVGEVIEILLDLSWSVQSSDETPLAWRERGQSLHSV